MKNTNTVKATNQTRNEFVFVYEKKDRDKKILFVGNSITLHGEKPEIGWNNVWGMAASCKEKDYVHQVIQMLKDDNINVNYCIAQVVDWEVKYKNGTETLAAYEAARDFCADVIVIRCIENCPENNFDAESFENAYKELINFFDPENKAKVILTTSFWKHKGDSVIRKIAEESGYILTELSDLGDIDTMTAKGLFEHSGVAMHPGDLGMKTIAERIVKNIKDFSVF